MDSSPKSSEELPPQTFKYEEHSKRNHPNHLPRSQSSLKSNLKVSKPRRISTTNFQRQRTHEEHEEHEEKRISNKLIARDSL